MYKKISIHFVGIGGIGMSGIAEVLLNLGYPVSGSDVKKSAATERLKSLGAKIFIRHREKNIAGADVVVFSSAVAKNNPELGQAHKLKIPVIRRAEMLAELMRLTKYGIAVAGTHGKTTTTSLLAHIFHTAGLDPTMIIGGKVNSLKTNAKLGRGDFMIVEADESDGSFLHLMPTMAIITNMDPDHMENFGNFEKYRAAFQSFCEKIPFYGLVVLCGEHPETKKLAETLDKRILTYGFSNHHHYSAHDIVPVQSYCRFVLAEGDKTIGTFDLSLAGKHNVLNALAAIAIARDAGISYSSIRTALASFGGVGRRLEVLYKGGGMVVIDDYGHHPVEITATLAAVRESFSGRLIVLFQPHRYTRTESLYKDFLHCFGKADHVYLMKIYAAGEAPIKGINSRQLAKDLAKYHASTSYIGSGENVVHKITSQIQPGDVILSLGAGDITQYGKKIAAILEKRNS